MSRKDDLKLLFNFMIELLKEEGVEERKISTGEESKKLIVEKSQEKTNFGVFDAPRIKTIMDKIDAKEHDNAIVKQALNVQAKDYKKEIEDLKEAFKQKILKENKLVDDNGFPLSGETSINIIN